MEQEKILKFVPSNTTFKASIKYQIAFTPKGDLQPIGWFQIVSNGTSKIVLYDIKPKNLAFILFMDARLTDTWKHKMGQTLELSGTISIKTKDGCQIKYGVFRPKDIRSYFDLNKNDRITNSNHLVHMADDKTVLATLTPKFIAGMKNIQYTEAGQLVHSRMPIPGPAIAETYEKTVATLPEDVKAMFTEQADLAFGTEEKPFEALQFNSALKAVNSLVKNSAESVKLDAQQLKRVAALGTALFWCERGANEEFYEWVNTSAENPDEPTWAEFLDAYDAMQDDIQKKAAATAPPAADPKAEKALATTTSAPRGDVGSAVTSDAIENYKALLVNLQTSDTAATAADAFADDAQGKILEGQKLINEGLKALEEARKASNISASARKAGAHNILTGLQAELAKLGIALPDPAEVTLPEEATA